MIIPTIVSLAAALLASALGFENVHDGDACPPFELKTVEGKAFSSGKELNAPVNLVAFCRLGQDYSEKLLKDLGELQESAEGKGIKIAVIFSGGQETAKIMELKERLKLTFPILVDPNRDVYGAYGVIVAPVVGFLDGKGALRFYYASYRSDFSAAARANIAAIEGKITAEERNARLKTEKAAPPSMDPASARYRLGLQLSKAGRMEEAIREFSGAWESKPPQMDAGLELGFALLTLGKNEEAHKVFSSLTALEPDNPKVAGGMGAALIRIGKGDEGSGMLQRAIEQHPRIPLLYLEMGRWHEKQGAAQKAMECYRNGLEAAVGAP